MSQLSALICQPTWTAVAADFSRVLVALSSTLLAWYEQEDHHLGPLGTELVVRGQATFPCPILVLRQYWDSQPLVLAMSIWVWLDSLSPCLTTHFEVVLRSLLADRVGEFPSEPM